MSHEDLKAQAARKALRLCELRLASGMSNVLPTILESCKSQLEWLVAYFEGRQQDRKRLGDILIGHYAVREMDQSDEDLVNALTFVQGIAGKAAKGLRVDPRELEAFLAQKPEARGH